MDIKDIIKQYLDIHKGTAHKDDLEVIVWNLCTPEEYLDFIEKNSGIFGEGKFSDEARKKMRMASVERDRIVELEKMRKNPMQYPIENVYSFVKDGTFTFDELVKEELLWKNEKDEYGNAKWNPFPDGLEDNFEQFLTNQELSSSADCTDIYFFGTPGTGKTCLLQGILNYDGFNFNPTTQGGRYGKALTTSSKKGKPAKSNIGRLAAVINGSINVLKDDKIVSHDINIVELAGEDFRDRIVDFTSNIRPDMSEEEKEREMGKMNFSFELMGLNVTDFLVKSENPKVFFLVIDSMSNEKKHKDRPYFQSDMLNGFVHIFRNNEAVMKKVKAIHIVVTKADMLKDEKGEIMADRQAAIYTLLQREYKTPIQNLLKYLATNTWLNRSTAGKLFAFPFSLGRFYLGNLFRYDKTDSERIVNVIKSITQGRRQETWWDKVVDFLG